MATTATGIEAARELDELYRSHAPEVFRYAYAVLGNRADAEDVTQTTFVNALRALERGERPRTPRNWLITIAHNLIRQRFRQLQARPREVELDHELPAAEVDDTGPSIDELVRALQRIPPTQRQALILRELEGRSYAEIGALLDVSQSALETLIFRARRSLAEELENLVTCDAAELALSQATDGRLGRKERRRLLAHLDECTNCARLAARGLKRRRAFKALAVLPLPFSLTLFKGAPSASAAAGLPTIGAGLGVGTTAGTATGVGAAGVGAKIAIGLAAVAVAGGAGYEGGQVVRDAAPPPRAAATIAAAGVVPAARTPSAERAAPRPAKLVLSKPTLRHAASTPKPARQKSKPAHAATPVKGRSASAPGHTKTATASPSKAMPATSPRAAARPKPKYSHGVGPAVERTRGRNPAAPVRVRPSRPAKPEHAAKRAKQPQQPEVAAKPETAPKQQKPAKAERAPAVPAPARGRGS